MLVTRRNFAEGLAALIEVARKEKKLSFDTETTTLFWWDSPHYTWKPRVFSMQFSSAHKDFYFDFGCAESTDPLGIHEIAALKIAIFSHADILWFIHNAKFDMHHMLNHGVEIAGTIHCTKSIARLVNNLEESRSLDDLSVKYLGASKMDIWPELEQRGAITKFKKWGDHEKTLDIPHFDKLSLKSLYEYGCRDTRLCYGLGEWQLARIKELNTKHFEAVPSNFGGSLWKVYENECKLTKTIVAMERRGIKLDMAFVKETYAQEIKLYKAALKELDIMAQPFFDSQSEIKTMDWLSSDQLLPLFEYLKIPYAFTVKGNASFDKKALEASGSDLAKKILEFRKHYKRAHTYFENYVWFADTNDILHCNIQQDGADTGRMSIWEPSLQNVPKRADKNVAPDFRIRRAFIPHPGRILLSLDADQVEYRMMLDYAKEMALIQRIIDEGLDIHEATKLELGLDDREVAKTLNFMILYGSGCAKLCITLFKPTVPQETLQALYMIHIRKYNFQADFQKQKKLCASLTPEQFDYNMNELKKADALLKNYFKKLPNVQAFTKKVKKKAKEEGVIFNWLGRILFYGKGDDYKSPNGLIQGGVGDFSKIAMNRCQDALSTTNSYMLLQIHDELLFDIDPKDTPIINTLMHIMETSYHSRHITLTAGAGWSKKSWGELEDGVPLQ
jgi:DNA polymerase-1